MGAVKHPLFFHGTALTWLFALDPRNSGGVCYGYSLETTYCVTCNEYPKYMFSWRNKKNNNVDIPSTWRYDIRVFSH